MILNFNIKAKRKKLKTFIDYYIFQITNMFLKIFTPFDSKRALQNKSVSPQASVAQTIADEMVFRRFRGEGVEFF